MLPEDGHGQIRGPSNPTTLLNMTPCPPKYTCPFMLSSAGLGILRFFFFHFHQSNECEIPDPFCLIYMTLITGGRKVFAYVLKPLGVLF